MHCAARTRGLYWPQYSSQCRYRDQDPTLCSPCLISPPHGQHPDKRYSAFIAAVSATLIPQPIQISDDGIAKSIGGIIRTNSDCFHGYFLNLTVRLNDNSGKTKFGRRLNNLVVRRKGVPSRVIQRYLRHHLRNGQAVVNLPLPRLPRSPIILSFNFIC